MVNVVMKRGDWFSSQDDASRPLIMGILNVTPDSFSDGGCFVSMDRALAQAQHLIDSGADIIDIGGESTRPGARRVSSQEELERVLPVLKQIKKHFPSIKVSIDTYKPEVMQASLADGADMINDVCALECPGAIDVLANSEVPVCLMHKKGTPLHMQDAPQYQSLIEEVYQYLELRIADCLDNGIAKERLIIDVGFGFGKTIEHNLSLIRHLSEFQQFGVPILIGVSRKSTIGNLLNRPVEQRLAGSLAAAVMAYLNGASIIRVHDVAETVDAFKMVGAITNAA